MLTENTSTKTTQKERPGLAFLGWATATAAGAAATYGLGKDVSDLIHVISPAMETVPPAVKLYVRLHLAIESSAEVLGIVGLSVASIVCAKETAKSLYRIAERHFDNKRLKEMKL